MYLHRDLYSLSVNVLTVTVTFWQTQGSRPGQTDESLSHALLDKFVDAGGNFIDTADVYQFGVSESIIGMTALIIRT